MSDDNVKVRRAREADYIFWLKNAQWHPTEAAILLGGYEPASFPDGSLSYESLAEDVDGIHRLIIESINDKEMAVVNSPADWIEWAKRQNITLPPALAEASAKVGAGDTAKTSLTEIRVTAIVQAATELGYMPMAIKYGGKAAIKSECLEKMAGAPHRFTDSTFDTAWKVAAKRKLVEVEDSEMYRNK